MPFSLSNSENRIFWCNGLWRNLILFICLQTWAHARSQCSMGQANASWRMLGEGIYRHSWTPGPAVKNVTTFLQGIKGLNLLATDSNTFLGTTRHSECQRPGKPTWMATAVTHTWPWSCRHRWCIWAAVGGALLSPGWLRSHLRGYHHKAWTQRSSTPKQWLLRGWSSCFMSW